VARIVQLLPGPKVVPQVRVWVKSPLFTPVKLKLKLKKFTVPVPIFVKVTV